MKRIILILSLCALGFFALAAETVTLGTGQTSATVLSSNDLETIIQYRIGSFESKPVEIGGEKWNAIYLNPGAVTHDKGFPQLPVFNRSIIVPNRAKMKIEVYDVKYEDLDLHIVPSKGHLNRDVNPEDVPYAFGDVYGVDDFYPGRIAGLSEPYILRDFRGIVVQTTPFAYNPVSRKLRVFTSFRVRVYADGRDTVNTLSPTPGRLLTSYRSIYENHFLNWDSQRYTMVDETFGKMLVICHSNYLSQAQPFVDWKIQKGIPTELIEFSTIGSTYSQLQTYIQNRYDADNEIAYVQLIGDLAHVPSPTSDGGAADPLYSLVSGSDHYPDIFIGRFSAESATDVTTQVNKSIAYERDATTSDTWLSRAFGIGSSSGTGDDGEYDWEHIDNIKTDLVNYGYTTVDEIYYDSSTASQVSTAVNAGRGFGNYCGHGSVTSWSTTGFNNTNVNALTNGDMTPFILSVACVNGDFSSTCFAEAWLRKSGGGAVAFYGSSVNQPWNPPMIAQDETTDLLVAEEAHTIGSLFYNGSCQMLDESGSYYYYVFDTWHIFGDASLVARTKTPLSMAVSHPSNIVSGTTSVSVSTGVSNALVAITYDNEIYGRGFTDASGNVVLNLVDPPSGDMDYTITATAYNRVTYVGTLAQTTADGPWMEVSGVSYSDSNDNTPEYAESGTFDVTFYNSGTQTASNVAATLSCPTSGITMTDDSHTISSLAAGSSTLATGAFAISIADGIPNGTIGAFTITMTGSSTWTHNFNLTIAAPELAFGAMTVSDPMGDGDGLIDPGETVQIDIPLLNTGASASPSGSASLSCVAQGITIGSPSAVFGSIPAEASADLSFTLSAASDIGEGTLIGLDFEAEAGAYSAANTENVEVGAPLEVIIGTGTSDQSYPLDRYYNYSTHEAIYLASEIGTAGTIKSIGYYKASGTDVNAINPVTIYMKNTTASSLASGTYSTSGYTQVYSGSFPNTSTSGWMEIDLQNQFSYDGSSNLSILIVKGYQSWTSYYPLWRYSSASPSRARQARSDNAQPSSLTATSNLPNLRLRIYPSGGTSNPAISIDPTSISETLTSGSSSTRALTISNPGSADLTWSIAGRSIEGSTLTCSASQYVPGETEDWTFSVYNASSDSEWLENVIITFPTGVTVNGATSFTGGSGGSMDPDQTSGSGITITWHGEGSSGWGVVYPNETAVATVNVTIGASVSGNLNLGYQIAGDVYGSEPHTVSGNIILSQSGAQPPDWYSADPTSGTISPGSSATLTITFDTAGLADGTYTSSLIINSNATNNPSLDVPLSLTVYTDQNPYPTDPRFVAEWEPAQGALVRYPLGLPYPLLADLSNDGLLYVVVSSSNQSACNTALSGNGVNMANVNYINAETDTYWIRDYGPWTIFDSGEMKIVDFIYNRPRPDDDVIPTTVAGYLGLEHYDMDLTATGGNVMCDGHEAAMSTNLILEENPGLTLAGIETMAQNYLGVTDYQFYTDPNNTYIDHIDCWGKLLDVDKVLIRSVPTSHAQYDEIEATVDEWEAKTSGYGTPYRIYRVYTPNNEPYTNSYIMNKRIYVPLMGTANDSAALAAYEAAMPGYTVTGYTYGSWESTDALHCRVNTVFDAQMIHVWHVPPTSATANSTITVNVDITHSNPLETSQTYVAYRHSETGAWQTVLLTHVSGDAWTAQIPTPAYGETLYYYILATDATARSTFLPLCAEHDPFGVLVDVQGANDPPTITLPDGFSFEMNASLEVDFSPYVDDSDGDDLTLSCSGNINVLVSIDGLTVTFSAAPDWHGTEELTFSVSDGVDADQDSVLVTVNLNYLAVPQVTITNPATGTLRIEWPAVPNASSYEVWSCAGPYGTYTYLGTTANLFWEDTMAGQRMRFYQVIARDESMTKKQ